MDVDNESASSTCQGETPCECSSVAFYGECHRRQNHLGRHKRGNPRSLLRASGGAKVVLSFAGNVFLRRASSQNNIFFSIIVNLISYLVAFVFPYHLFLFTYVTIEIYFIETAEYSIIMRLGFDKVTCFQSKHINIFDIKWGSNLGLCFLRARVMEPLSNRT